MHMATSIIMDWFLEYKDADTSSVNSNNHPQGYEPNRLAFSHKWIIEFLKKKKKSLVFTSNTNSDEILSNLPWCRMTDTHRSDVQWFATKRMAWSIITWFATMDTSMAMEIANQFMKKVHRLQSAENSIQIMKACAAQTAITIIIPLIIIGYSPCSFEYWYLTFETSKIFINNKMLSLFY